MAPPEVSPGAVVARLQPNLPVPVSTAAMVGLMAAAVFGLSLDRFVDDGGRFGNNFDLMLGNGWLPAPTDLRSALERDQDIEGLMLLGAGTARSGEATVELVGVESVRGGLVPRVRSGRAPTTADEVALGRLTAGHLDLRIGDDLLLNGGGASATYRVVGIAVIPTWV